MQGQPQMALTGGPRRLRNLRLRVAGSPAAAPESQGICLKQALAGLGAGNPGQAATEGCLADHAGLPGGWYGLTSRMRVAGFGAT